MEIERHQRRSSNSNLPPLTPIRTLVVDDEPNILLTLRLILESKGIIVQTANSAKNAEPLLGESRFDVMVTDLSMETRTSGYDLVQIAKKQAPRLATIVISGYPDLLVLWQEQGADAGLAKPTDIPELLQTIEQLAHCHRE